MLQMLSRDSRMLGAFVSYTEAYAGKLGGLPAAGPSGRPSGEWLCEVRAMHSVRP